MKSNIKLGDIVYGTWIGDNRYKKDDTEFVVFKVGAKYIYVGKHDELAKEYCWIKVDKQNLEHVSNYSSEWQFFLTMHNLEQHHINTCAKLMMRNFPSHLKLSTKDANTIIDILKKAKDNNDE